MHQPFSAIYNKLTVISGSTIVPQPPLKKANRRQTVFEIWFMNRLPTHIKFMYQPPLCQIIASLTSSFEPNDPCTHHDDEDLNHGCHLLLLNLDFVKEIKEKTSKVVSGNNKSRTVLSNPINSQHFMAFGHTKTCGCVFQPAVHNAHNYR